MASKYVEPYRQQVEAGGTARLPGADANAFGAAFGAGLAQAGAAVERVVIDHKERKVRRERETEAADVAVRLAETNTALEAAIAELQTNAPPAAEGHGDRVRQLLDRSQAEFVGGIRDERVRNHYRERFAALRSRFETREMGWQIGVKTERQVADVQDANRMVALRLGSSRGADPGALEEGIEDIRATWRMQTGIAEDLRDKGEKADVRDAVVSWANARVLDNHQGLLKILDDGHLDEYGLTATDVERLRGGALVEERRAESYRLAQAAKVEAQQRADVAGVVADVERDVWVEPARMAQAIETAQATGDANLVKRVAAAGIENDVIRQTDALLPEQFDQLINPLLAKGEDRTDAEDIQLVALQRRAAAARAELEQRPGQFASRTGHEPPVIDWSNPAAGIAARNRWVEEVAITTRGRIADPLLPDDVKLIRKQLLSGGEAQLDALRTLRLFGDNAVRAVRQVDDSEELQLAVTLPDRTMEQLVAGAAALKGNPEVLDPVEADRVFSEIVHALPDNPGLSAAIRVASRKIYGSMMKAHGRNEWDEGNYRMGINKALGATGTGTGMAGGLHDYHGRTIWLPPGMTGSQFDTLLARAGPDAWVRGFGGVAPRWGGGGDTAGDKIFTGDARKGVLIPADGPGRYYLRINNGVVVDKVKRPIILDVSRMR